MAPCALTDDQCEVAPLLGQNRVEVGAHGLRTTSPPGGTPLRPGAVSAGSNTTGVGGPRGVGTLIRVEQDEGGHAQAGGRSGHQPAGAGQGSRRWCRGRICITA
ncbi:hypothetical protein [Ornithinimicrobium kibberense]|uniref:hypothetical protein n=1 Tax=Ornithinimicrobium kibberense TaxID=282060 RepID=UPI003610178C